MTLYRVTMTEDKLMALIGNNLGAYMVESVPEDVLPSEHDKAMAQPKRTAANRAVAQRQRTSKVNATLLAALNNGPQSLKEMKAALSNAGMAPSSISTGLAQLQRKNQIERVGDGLYALKQAAE